MASENPRATIEDIAAEYGLGYVLGALIDYAERQRDQHDPNAVDDGRSRAQHLAWKADAEVLQDVTRRLRH